MKVSNFQKAAVRSMTSGILLLSFFVSSCATTGMGGYGTVGVLKFDAREQQILNQARGVGATAGAVGGAILARNSRIGPLGGAAIGALGGLIAGEVVGQAQANQARELRLQNDQLRDLIAATKAANDKIAAQNRAIAARIREIKQASKAERGALAKAELRGVDASLRNVDEVVSSRKQGFSGLPKAQYAEVAYEVRRGEMERAKLASHRDELSKMSLAAN